MDLNRGRCRGRRGRRRGEKEEINKTTISDIAEKHVTGRAVVIGDALERKGKIPAKTNPIKRQPRPRYARE